MQRHSPPFSLTYEQYQIISSHLPKKYFLEEVREERQRKARNISGSIDPGHDGPKSQEITYDDQTNISNNPKIRNIKSLCYQNERSQKCDESFNSKCLHVQLQKSCQQILQKLKAKRCSDIFIDPVDPVKLKIPTYFDVIKYPMDISMMQKKLKDGKYDSFEEFKEDLDLIAQNCEIFNAANTVILNICQKFKAAYKKLIESSSIVKVEENIKSSKPEFKSTKQKLKKIGSIQTECQQKSDTSQLKKSFEKDDQVGNNETKDASPKEKTQNDIFMGDSADSIKYFNQHDREQLVKRIQRLDRDTMIEFFEKIGFEPGQSMDFQTASFTRLTQIDEKLRRAEKEVRRKEEIIAKKENSRV